MAFSGERRSVADLLGLHADGDDADCADSGADDAAVDDVDTAAASRPAKGITVEAPSPTDSSASPTSSPEGLCVSGGSSRILRRADYLWLSSNLPRPEKASGPVTSWTALYLSHRDGKSFTTLVHSLCRVPHTLLVVKDGGGGVFGMYCGDAWLDKAELDEAYLRKERPAGKSAAANFYGTGDCALLAVRPEPRLYRPTRMNENYMYLQTTWIEEDMNGIAMGGLPGLFGVHLDTKLERGKFRGANGVCMTFNNPCLASSEDFDIEEVEVWAPGETKRGLAVPDSKVSIVHSPSAAHDKELLELMGQRFYSPTPSDN